MRWLIRREADSKQLREFAKLIPRDHVYDNFISPYDSQKSPILTLNDGLTFHAETRSRTRRNTVVSFPEGS